MTKRSFIQSLLSIMSCTVFYGVVIAQEISPRKFSPDGPIFDMKRKGDILYMTGDFDKVGILTGGAANFENGKDEPSVNLPYIDGDVYEIIPDGSGGWFAGGDFYQVNNSSILNLVHILPDGKIDEAFLLNPNNPVKALALSGTVLYIGGQFSSINGQSIPFLAAYDLQGGTIVPLNGQPDGEILDLHVFNNSLILGGKFKKIGLISQQGLARIDLISGVLISFPSVSSGSVNAVYQKDSILYVGGDFNSQVTFGPFSETRSRLFAFDLSGNKVLNWAPVISGFRVNTICGIDSLIYFGGLFTSVNGQGRKNLAALTVSGNIAGYKPEPNAEVFTVYNYDDKLWVGGDFTQISSRSQSFAAALDKASGIPSSWDMQADWAIRCFSDFQGNLMAGGEFYITKAKSRNNACAINLRTNELTGWNPQGNFLTGTGVLVDLFRDVVYLTGWDQTTMENIKAFDVQAGVNIPYLNVHADNSVNQIVQDPISGNLYFCGNFQQVKGQSRKRIAGIDPSGNILDLSADIDGEIWSMALLDSTIYFGGRFNNVNSEKRFKLASVNLKGELLPWNPQHNILLQSTSITVNAAFSDKVIISGSFTQIGGENRNRIAAVHPVTGVPLDWDLKASKTISTIKAESDGLLISGNAFESVNGIQVNKLAYISLYSALPVKLFPDYGINNVFTMETFENKLYMGGDFRILGDRPHPYFASMVFENSGFVFRRNIETISPKTGGNIGDVSLEITGNGFAPGTRVSLGRNGIEEIFPVSGSTFITHETRLKTVFDLRGKTPGLMDIIIDIPGDTTYIFDEEFTIQEGTGPLPWANVVLAAFATTSQTQAFNLNYGNNGDTDAEGVPIWLAVSPNIEILDFGWKVKDVIEPSSAYYDSIPEYIVVDTLLDKPYNAKIYSFILPRIPAGSSKTIPVSFRGISNGKYYARAWTTDPMYGSPLKYVVGECLDAIMGLVTNFIPYAGCAYGTFDVLVSPMVDPVLDPGFGSADYTSSYLQTIGETAIGCYLDATTIGVGRVVFETVDMVVKGKSIYNYGQKCFTPEEQEDQEGEFVSSRDPNDKTGPAGQGAEGWLTTDRPFPYMIRFENDAEATAPAKIVIIRDTLDLNVFDLSSLELKTFSIGNKFFTIPPGKKEYEGIVDLRPEVPALTKLEVSLNHNTGELVWKFTGLDTATMLPMTYPLDGFLPPNTPDGKGQGSVSFDIHVFDTISTGTIIRNNAAIYFDFNSPIVTNTWSLRADNDSPFSQALSLPDTIHEQSFTVEWTGTDSGSGIRYYDVLYREDGERWKYAALQTDKTSIKFVGKPGKEYEFYTIASDTALNREIIPLMPDVKTYIAMNAPLGLVEKEEISLIIYPNPANTFLNIEINNTGGIVNLRFLDVSGRLLLSGEYDFSVSKTIQLNLENTPSGLYILEWESNDGNGRKKVVRQ